MAAAVEPLLHVMRPSRAVRCASEVSHMSDQPLNDVSTNREDENFSQIMARHARKDEQIARQLSREAMAQWQKAISGVLALPTAIALGAAANTLFIAAFIERGF